jgi:ribosome assembly protein RRB1
MEAALIKHNGSVNRLRVTNINNKRLAASWSDLGKVFIYDLTAPLLAVTDAEQMADYVRRDNHLPLFHFSGHQTEGFALDWSSVVDGQLVTGDCNKDIHTWSLDSASSSSSFSWNVDQRPYIGHTASVEDIQWSPSEATVFASCSVDKSIRIWDTRAGPGKANMITCENAHTRDVNVINWNKTEPFIASGGDDAYIKIWDLRLFQQNKPVAVLKHHTKPITSIEWNQQDSTVFAASSEDNQLTIWDLAVEKDDEDLNNNKMNNNNDNKFNDLPPQLLFIHQGQKEMKELHWHPQIPGVLISTAHSGFNIFKTISV